MPPSATSAEVWTLETVRFLVEMAATHGTELDGDDATPVIRWVDTGPHHKITLFGFLGNDQWNWVVDMDGRTWNRPLWELQTTDLDHAYAEIVSMLNEVATRTGEPSTPTP